MSRMGAVGLLRFARNDGENDGHCEPAVRQVWQSHGVFEKDFPVLIEYYDKKEVRL
ncbi:MAG: hypothetical protein ABWK15_02220 [Dissulfuribacterales bacterium]